jgi:hypothetical protein
MTDARAWPNHLRKIPRQPGKVAVPCWNLAATFLSNSNESLNFDAQLLITRINRRGLLPPFVEMSRASVLADSFLLKP